MTTLSWAESYHRFIGPLVVPIIPKCRLIDSHQRHTTATIAPPQIINVTFWLNFWRASGF